MNSLYRESRFLVALFSVLYCTSFSSDWSNCSQIKFPLFTYEQKSSSANSRVHSDFSHYDTWNNGNDHRLSKNTNDFDSYTKEDFEYLRECGYIETELLNQCCFYMNNEFVQYAQTCPGYKDVIQKLYAELKNLNLVQKIYRVAKGTYCKGLQDRITYLYNQVNTVKNTNHYRGQKAAKSEPAFFVKQFAEYKTLESVYDPYAPCLAKAIKKRSACNNNERINKSYNLNSNIKKLLSHYGHELALFTHVSGNELQQAIHQESLDILNCIDTLPQDSILYDHQEALIDLATAMVDYNQVGMIDKAMTIGDLCWTLLDYGWAIAEGAALGVYSAADDILTNPIEATVSIIAGKQILAFQLCKVLYNVADISVTAMSDYGRAQEKWNKYAAPLNNIIDAINKKEITVRDAIKGGTAFIVGYRAQGKLLGGLGKFCTTIKHKSINFVKNSPLLEPVEYLTTPEGLLFKATAQSNKLKQTEQFTASNIKNNINQKIVKNKNILPIQKKGSLIIEQGGKFSESEKKAAEYMCKLGNDVILRAPKGTRVEGGTSDLLVNGINYDVYTPITTNPNRIISAIAAKKDQAFGIVLDLSQTNVTLEQLGDIKARLIGKGITNISDIIVLK